MAVTIRPLLSGAFGCLRAVTLTTPLRITLMQSKVHGKYFQPLLRESLGVLRCFDLTDCVRQSDVCVRVCVCGCFHSFPSGTSSLVQEAGLKEKLDILANELICFVVESQMRRSMPLSYPSITPELEPGDR